MELPEAREAEAEAGGGSDRAGGVSEAAGTLGTEGGNPGTGVGGRTGGSAPPFFLGVLSPLPPFSGRSQA